MTKVIIAILVAIIGFLVFQLAKIDIDRKWINFTKLLNDTDNDWAATMSKLKSKLDKLKNSIEDSEQKCVTKISNLEANLKSELDKVIKCMEFEESQKSRPRDCQDIQELGQTTTGIYKIYPGSGSNVVSVRCDMDTAPGGWTVIQRRISSSDFYRNWNEYQVGFGDLNSNFWLGNQHIHLISTQAWYQLHVDLTNLNDEHRFAEYQVFSVGDAESKYRLFVDGYSGNAGDSLTPHNGMKFSTKDRDNDNHNGNCAVEYLGAWWYSACHSSNLNGEYGNTKFGQGVNWKLYMGYTNPLKETEMKIRRWHT